MAAIRNVGRLRQYLDMINSSWGSWTLFQDLLTVLRRIGDRHGQVSIANVATRWVLDHPFVGAVLIGKCDLRLLSSVCRGVGCGSAQEFHWRKC